MSLPTEKDVDEALQKLAETDEKMARATAVLTAAKEGLKIAKAKATPRQGTALERENEALMSPEYQVAVDALRDADYRRELLRLKREGWSLLIEVFRTLSANQRRT